MIFSWKKLIITLAVFILPSLVIGVSVHAQTVPDDLSSNSASLGFDIGPTENDIDLTMTPENPQAFEPVTLQISSDYIDLSRYNITWSVDGKIIESGIGKQIVRTQTKNYGDPTAVIITVKTANATLQKKITLSPEDITLLWEAVDSYVPPFYEGKKLPSREAILKIISIPNFSNTQTKSFDPRTGIYGWKRNDLPVQDVGGYGKDSFMFQHNKIRGTEDISVTANTLDNSHLATKNITLSFYDPKILFYERNITNGIRGLLAKEALSLATNDVTVEAEPYFFSVLKNNPNSLAINWRLNNEPVSLSDTKNKTSLTLQNPGQSGVATLDVSIENPSRIFQSAKKSLRVIFNK